MVDFHCSTLLATNRLEKEAAELEAEAEAEPQAEAEAEVQVEILIKIRRLDREVIALLATIKLKK